MNPTLPPCRACSVEPLPSGLEELSALPGLLMLALQEVSSSGEGLALPEPAFVRRLKSFQVGAPLVQVCRPCLCMLYCTTRVLANA